MIEHSVHLPVPRERAFDLWVGEISHWWPAERRHTGDPASEILVLETGRFFERARDGREVELGRVREWRRPESLRLDFYPGTDAEHPTDVTITFEPEGDGTRVTVRHHPTDASRDMWDSRAGRYVASWTLVLASFARMR